MTLAAPARFAVAAFLLIGSVITALTHAAEPEFYVHRDTWVDTMLATRKAVAKVTLPTEGRRALTKELRTGFERDFPVQWDWLRQDSGRSPFEWFSVTRDTGLEVRMIERALEGSPRATAELRQKFARLRERATPVTDPAWLRLYATACEQRRADRLASLRAHWPRVVFTKHYNLGGSHYAYTEGQSDAQNERTFVPGTALCLLELERATPRVTPLIEDGQGVIRDPDVSWDGRHLLFAWKKSDLDDDYHLYEYDLALAKVRQLTAGAGFADYEGVYLPDGGLVFTSTRCVQTVDCWWTEVSNLYTCDRDGGHLRRLTFDQVHDNYPTVLPDGRLVYTRWEYSDRGQIFVQGLFQMNPDGTGQTEFYGNNSWFPTALLHARGVPGTAQVVATFAGHHTLQAGKLGLIDPTRGRQENQGAQLIAPVRPTPAERIDTYGQEGELFQYPYPLSSTEFLMAYRPDGWAEPARFGIYWFHADGRRELLASDPAISCNQPIPLAARPLPPPRSSHTDFQQETAVYSLRDVYAGPGLKGIPRGAVRALRVIALNYRAAGIGHNYNRGPAGSALISTPIAVGNGAWDVKVVLGDAPVHPDGSACFLVPARTPVYFQALDERGYAIQSMRSWSTLQPGEIAGCGGCHEPKNQAPPAAAALTLAAQAGPQPLTPFYGPARGFSFAREIQPILDRQCVRCHRDSDALAQRLHRVPANRRAYDEVTTRAPAGPPDQPAAPPEGDYTAATEKLAFSLRDTPVVEAISARRWSEGYLGLAQALRLGIEGESSFVGLANDVVNWISAQSVPDLLPPYYRGAARSQLLVMLNARHGGVTLNREERDKLACWIDLLVPYCGDYTEAQAWSADEQRTYVHFLEKRHRMEELERATLTTLRALKPGETAAAAPR